MGKDEDRLGSIKPGKLADLIVIDRDILSQPPEELLGTKVLMTIVVERPFISVGQHFFFFGVEPGQSIWMSG